MERSAPPFRADHVGSLIRPARLIEARRAFMDAKISLLELREVEDASVREVIVMQENIGLHSITDGEFRRESYLRDFFASLGVELRLRASTDLVYRDDQGNTEPGNKTIISQKIRWKKSPNTDAFSFLKRVTTQTPKVTIPAPTQIHLFSGPDGISREVYPDLDEFWSDIVDAYAAELKALANAGCTYVQLDETCLPKLADPAIQEVVRNRGEDWQKLTHTYADVINRIVDKMPPTMRMVMHHCRGNRGNFWQAQTGYDVVAEVMFSEIRVDGYLLEYDSPRAGDFSPLRFLPNNKVVALGLISSKNKQLESVEELKRRIDEASQFVPLDRLCLCPQCGFSSTFAFSPLTQDEQRAKLERLVEVARQVWDA